MTYDLTRDLNCCGLEFYSWLDGINSPTTLLLDVLACMCVSSLSKRCSSFAALFPRVYYMFQSGSDVDACCIFLHSARWPVVKVWGNAMSAVEIRTDLKQTRCFVAAWSRRLLTSIAWKDLVDCGGPEIGLRYVSGLEITEYVNVYWVSWWHTSKIIYCTKTSWILMHHLKIVQVLLWHTMEQVLTRWNCAVKTNDMRYCLCNLTLSCLPACFSVQ